MLLVASDSVALFLFWLYASAGWHKLRNRSHYSSLMQRQGLLKLQSLTGVIGSIEIATAIVVLNPSSRYWGAIMAIAITLIYLCHLALLYRQGKRDIDCGCSGPATSLNISPALLLRNTGLLFISGLCFYPSSINSADNIQWLAIPIAIMAILLYLCIEQIIFNSQKRLLL